jgi:hypothetical protein
VPGEGDRDDVGYEDRVKHRFSIADVEGDELLLGAVAWRMAFDRLLKFRSMAPQLDFQSLYKLTVGIISVLI